MTERRSITVMREQVDAEGVMRCVANLTDEAMTSVEGSVLYPYVRFAASCMVPTMIGRKRVSVECLIDGVNGLGATSDPIVADERAAGDEVLLQTEISADAALRSAHRTVTHRLSRKFRTIAGFDVTLDPVGTIHKRFWIVRIGDSRIMADSVTGNMHSLD